MPTPPVTLDMSTFRPLPGQSAPQSVPTGQPSAQNAPVTLDMSTFVPLPGQSAPSDELQTSPTDNILEKAGKFLLGVPEGIGETMFKPVATVTDIADKLTGQNPGAFDDEMHSLAGDNDADHGVAQSLGRGIGQIVQFALGDEALQGMSIADKLAQGSKLAKILESHPALVQVMSRAITDGAVGAAQGGLNYGTAGAAVEGALGGAAGSVLGGLAGLKAVRESPQAAKEAEVLADGVSNLDIASAKAADQKFSDIPETRPGTTTLTTPGILKTLQAFVRSAGADVARDANVDAPDEATSIRDVLTSVGRKIRASAQADYRALDDASGGRWQRYDDQLSTIKDRLSNLVEGTGDDDIISRLEQRQNEIQASQAQMIEDLKADGKVDPSLADRAAARYRQAMALQDVGQAVRSSIKQGVVLDNVSQAAIDPSALVNRLVKLNDIPLNGGPSRLVQAMGEKPAAYLLDNATLAHNVMQEAKNIPTLNSTGRTAVRALIRKYTVASPNALSRSRTATDWKGALNEFESMPNNQKVAAFGDDIAKVRGVFQTEARKQAFNTLMKDLGIRSLSVGSGIEGLHLLNHLFSR